MARFAAIIGLGSALTVAICVTAIYLLAALSEGGHVHP